MRGLDRYAWRSLRARPARTLLTVGAIALGVAVLVAGLAVDAGIGASIDRTVATVAGRADLRVSAFAEAGLSRATLDAITGLPGAAAAAPATERRVPLAPTPERPGTVDPVTVVGIDPGLESRVHDLTLAAGSSLTRLDEPSALITERLARSDALAPGAELVLVGASGPVRVRVVGILAGDGPLPVADGRAVLVPLGVSARLATTDEEAAPTDPDAPLPAGGISRIDVVLEDGVTATQVAGALEAAIAEPYVLAEPSELAATLRASTADLRSTTGLLAAVALFAGAFLIVNTLSMTVAERARELALFRAAGASRRDVVRIVTLQGLVLGVAGSFAGVVAGVGLAAVLADALRSAGSVPLDRPLFGASLLAGALALGVLVTLVAAVEPARRAARLSPIEALRARGRAGRTTRARLRWLSAILVVVALAGSFAFPAGPGPLGAGRALLVYALLLAAVLLAPPLLAPLGRVAGVPFAAVLRLEERLARAALVRDRGRTGLTIGALVVGLTMIVALGAVATNARLVATSWIRDVVPGDEVLSALAPVPLDELSPEPDLEAVDGVAFASPIATFDLAVNGRRVQAAAVSGADLARDGRLAFRAGARADALAGLDTGGVVVVPLVQADRLGLALGDVVAVRAMDGTTHELTVAGIADRSLPAGSGEALLIGWPDATTHFGVAGADAFAVRYASSADAEAREAVAAIAMERALTVAPVERIEGAVTGALDRLFGLFDLLALAAVIVAGLGIVNTLSMDVWERVREIGVLRAAGMSRRQVWRMVLVEAGILGTIGALVGSVAGLVVGGVLVVTAAGGFDVPLAPPWLAIGLAALLGIGLSMAAASQPARLASRLSIVRAVRAE